jgi:hypothetical protein
MMTTTLLVIALEAGIARADDLPAPRTPPLAATTPGAANQGQASDLTLTGLIIRDGGDALAIIEDRRTRKPGLYRVGAPLAGGRLAEILPDRVRIAFGDGLVDVRLAMASGPVAPTAARPAVPLDRPERTQAASSPPHVDDPTGRFRSMDRAVLESFLGAPDLQANVTPLERHGGLRVGEVPRSGLFEALGLSTGDIIHNVNGRVPDGETPLPEVIRRAASGGMLRFQVKRRGAMDVRYIHLQP